MSLKDIDFSEGDRQQFLVEVPAGSLHAPKDILVEPGSSRYLVLKTASAVPPAEGDIFIIND